MVYLSKIHCDYKNRNVFSVLLLYVYMNKILYGGFMDFFKYIASLGLWSIPIYLFVVSDSDFDVLNFAYYVFGVMGLATIVKILQMSNKK